MKTKADKEMYKLLEELYKMRYRIHICYMMISV